MELSQSGTHMTREVISVGPDCLLNEAVAIMGQHKISFIIVAKNSKPLGVLSERDIVRLACQHIDPEQVCIKDVMSSPVITVTEDANIFQVYDLLNTKKIRHMVVVDSAGLIAGLTTLTNILGGLSIEFFVELKQVANIMSQNITTLNTAATVQQALELMTEKRISCIIITRNQHPVGIITERDITQLYGRAIVEDATVATIMTTPVRTVDSCTFIPQANAIMREEKMRHLVIVNSDGRLAGLISQTDIARRIEEHYVDFLRTLVKEQEKKLLYEDERFSILFEHNPNAVLSYDGNGTIVNTNRASILLSGYNQQEMVGKSFDSFIHPEDIDRARDTFYKAREHKSGLGEFRILQKSGRVAHVFNTFLPIYADDRLHRIYSIMHDISATKASPTGAYSRREDPVVIAGRRAGRRFRPHYRQRGEY